MKCWLALPVVVVLIASFGAGDNPPPRPGPAGRAVQFQTNYTLIQLLVENSVRLAAEDDPLKRADYCDGLVEGFALEMHKAAESRDDARVAELGQHLHDLVSQGVAANLRLVRRTRSGDAALEKDLHGVRAQAEKSLRPVEEQLKRGIESADTSERVLKLIGDARAELQKAVELRDDHGPDADK
jgi:hypothetical protein